MSEPNRKTLKNIILTKDMAWEYEKEVRLLPNKLDFEVESDILYLSIKPKAIIMGSKIECKYVPTLKKFSEKKVLHYMKLGWMRIKKITILFFKNMDYKSYCSLKQNLVVFLTATFVSDIMKSVKEK